MVFNVNPFLEDKQIILTTPLIQANGLTLITFFEKTEINKISNTTQKVCDHLLIHNYCNAIIPCVVTHMDVYILVCAGVPVCLRPMGRGELVYIHRHVDGGQRSAQGIIPQEPSYLVY